MESFTSTMVIGAALAAFLFSINAKAQEMDSDAIINQPSAALEAQAQNRIAEGLESLPLSQAQIYTGLQATRDYGRAYVPTMSQTNF
jgi:hypothetical protein